MIFYTQFDFECIVNDIDEFEEESDILAEFTIEEFVKIKTEVCDKTFKMHDPPQATLSLFAFLVALFCYPPQATINLFVFLVALFCYP